MKTLSIKQPWASLIAHGIKDIENRSWRTHYRGKIYIHASGTPSKEPYKVFTDVQFEQIEESNFDLKVFESYKETSRIIGEVDIVDCVINHPSIWAEQTIYEIDKYENYKEYTKPIYNWVLKNAVLYDEPILNVKGKLSLWEFEKPDLA